MPLPHDKDFDDEDNIFKDDYVTAELFDEEDEEMGIDVHEIDLPNTDKATYVRNEYKKPHHGAIEDIPDLQVTRKKLTAKMRSKGYTKIVLYKSGKKIIFL